MKTPSIKPRASHLSKNFAQLRTQRIDAKHSESIDKAIQLDKVIKDGKERIKTFNHLNKARRLNFAQARKDAQKQKEILRNLGLEKTFLK
jgi:hypothetical protein